MKFETVASYFPAGLHVMQTNAVLVFGALTTVALALLAFIASHRGRPVIGAFVAAAAWLFAGTNALIWIWTR